MCVLMAWIALLRSELIHTAGAPLEFISNLLEQVRQ